MFIHERSGFEALPIGTAQGKKEEISGNSRIHLCTHIAQSAQADLLAHLIAQIFPLTATP